MANQIRGIILEGPSCSGKTSLFKALKIEHTQLDGAERNTVFLGEHYSQTLNKIHGELVELTALENLQVLDERITMLEQLTNYADNMGEHSRRSRGIFYIFERFHLNYAISHDDSKSIEYKRLEKRLFDLNPIVVVCTIGDDYIEQRIKYRANLVDEKVADNTIVEYRLLQDRTLKAAEDSIVPTLIINTDSLDWSALAKEILAAI